MSFIWTPKLSIAPHTESLCPSHFVPFFQSQTGVQYCRKRRNRLQREWACSAGLKHCTSSPLHFPPSSASSENAASFWLCIVSYKNPRRMNVYRLHWLPFHSSNWPDWDELPLHCSATEGSSEIKENGIKATSTKTLPCLFEWNKQLVVNTTTPRTAGCWQK